MGETLGEMGVGEGSTEEWKGKGPELSLST